MEHQRIIPIWIVAALLAMLFPALYMGSYYALLDDQNGWAADGEVVADGSFRTRRRAEYRGNSPLFKKLLLPAHWMDRQFRPKYWRWSNTGEEFAP